MADEKKVWGIHTQDDSLFLQGNVIAIGWEEMGDLSVLAPDRESFRDKYLAVFPDAKKAALRPVQVCFSALCMRCKLVITLYSRQRLTEW